MRIAQAAKQAAAPVQQQEDLEPAAERSEAHRVMGEESEGNDTEDECEMTDTEEEEDPDLDSLEELMQKVATPVAFDAKFRYQRASIPSQKTRRRQEEEIEARIPESKRCKHLTSYLLPAKRKVAAMNSVGAAPREQLNEKEPETAYKEGMCNTAAISTAEIQRQVTEEKIRQLEKRLQSTDGQAA